MPEAQDIGGIITELRKIRAQVAEVFPKVPEDPNLAVEGKENVLDALHDLIATLEEYEKALSMAKDTLSGIKNSTPPKDGIPPKAPTP